MNSSRSSASNISREPGSPHPFLYLALPVMNEPGTLGRLMDCLARQTFRDFRLYACVNQPDGWHAQPERAAAIRNNAESLQILHHELGFPVTVMDRTSPGRGWHGRKLGVGYARKAVMDRILAEAPDDGIIVSLDADTVFGECYLESVVRTFARSPRAAALSVPYYHPVPADPAAARAMLRYEIYMRHYFLSLARIGSPYLFTALGSAMAVPVRACRAIGGMTPKLSGEDFYFLQKLRKYGPVLLWNEELVCPEARFSNRVFFGTGPAMIRGATGDWSGYPIYPAGLFDEIGELYRLLPEVWRRTPETRVVRFLSATFREEDPFAPLRANHRTYERFVRAFHEKFDGLRILQFLKTFTEPEHGSDEQNLQCFLDRFYPGTTLRLMGAEHPRFRFEDASIEVLDRIRIFLFEKEQEVRATSAPR